MAFSIYIQDYALLGLIFSICLLHLLHRKPTLKLVLQTAILLCLLWSVVFSAVFLIALKGLWKESCAPDATFAVCFNAFQDGILFINIFYHSAFAYFESAHNLNQPNTYGTGFCPPRQGPNSP